MKNSKFITRAIIVTGFLATVAVPAANAVSENANLGNSPLAQPAGPEAAGTSNGNGVGRPDTWGGCRGRHGNDNPGQGVGPTGSGGASNSNAGGNGNGNAYGLIKQNSCGGHTPDEDVEGSNYTLPQTR
jgi:hypothetical protein